MSRLSLILNKIFKGGGEAQASERVPQTSAPTSQPAPAAPIPGGTSPAPPGTTTTASPTTSTPQTTARSSTLVSPPATYGADPIQPMEEPVVVRRTPLWPFLLIGIGGACAILCDDDDDPVSR